jgi:hypothetical protein
MIERIEEGARAHLPTRFLDVLHGLDARVGPSPTLLAQSDSGNAICRRSRR